MQKYNFSQDFQDAILACLIKYPKDFYAFGEIIKPSYFTGSAAVEVAHRLIEYREKYGKYPNFTTLGNYTFTKLERSSSEAATETLEYVKKLATTDTSDKKAILDLSIRFAKERAIYAGVRKIHTAQMEGKMDKMDPVEIMQTAMAVGTNYDDLGLSLYHHSDRILDMVGNREYGVRTGFGLFDKLWKFGWAPGWLIVLLAPPKRFKTCTAINLALSIACFQDADVLYYACEISQELAAFRALTCLTGWTQDEFFETKEKGKMVAKEKMREKLFGTIWFKGYPSKSTTISEIKAHARQVISIYDLKPRAIVIDYAETVRPSAVDKTASDWRQQADIYTQARAMGAELGCCVIMPDRCNRETVGKKVPNMKSFQGAFEKAGIVDIAIGLCATDAEYKQDRLRYFVFLNRHGEAYKHYSGKVDPARMQITVDEEIVYDPDDADEDGRPPNRSMKHKAIYGADETQSD